MHRRACLAALAALATGGCLGGRSSDDPETSAPEATPSQGSRTVGRGRGPVRRVSIDDVAAGPRWLFVNESSVSWNLEHTEFAALDEPVRSIVDEAIEGTYETDDVSQELTAFLADVAHVKRGDRFYTIEASVPTYELRATRTDADPASIDGEVATVDEAEGRFPEHLLTEAWDDPVRLVHVDPDHRTFLERYDAVAYENLRSLVIEFEFERIDPGPPYTVEADRVPDDEVDDGVAFDLSAVSDPVREALREAVRWRGTDPSPDPPRELVDRYDGSGKFTANDAVYSFRIRKLRDLPLSFDLTVVDHVLEPGDRAALRLSLTNEGEGPLVLSHGVPGPFGLVQARKPDESEWILWTDAYEDAPNVRTSNRLVWGHTSESDERSLPAGETLEATYELPATSFPPGPYDLDLQVRARAPEDDREVGDRQRFAVQFTVAEEES